MLVFVIFLYIDMINTVTVYLHLFVFLVLCDFIFFAIKKLTRKNISYGTFFISAILVTIIYLSYGYYLAHNVVQTNYTVYSNKDIGVNNFRIVQITDSHIGATMDGNDFIKYMKRINKTNPDIVVVTGDFIDDDTTYEDMIKGCRGLGSLKTKYGVYFVYGNHDKGYYDYRTYNDDTLRKELKKNDVTILEDEKVHILNNIVLIGRNDSQTPARLTAKTLTKNIKKYNYIITLDHEPNDYDNEASAQMDLVISGHTHGGQLFPLTPVGELFGINDKTYGMEKRQNTTFIVSSGIGDWAIKFKTGTKSEYVVIDVKNNFIN